MLRNAIYDSSNDNVMRSTTRRAYMDEVVTLLNKISESSTHLTTKSSYTYSGRTVPRTTEILSSMIFEEYIPVWANSLGFKHKGYRTALKEASDKGTYTHESIERFLQTSTLPEYASFPPLAKDAVYFAFNSFLKWWDDINKGNEVELIFSEKTLSCKYFGGTLDCLLKINGKYWLIDFKTSNHMSFKYCLQLSSYKYMLKECENIDVAGCLVLMLEKKKIHYSEYVLDLAIEEHRNFMQRCMEEFMMLTAAFYGRKEIEYDYKRIFGGKNV